MRENDFKKIGKTALSMVMAGTFAFTPVLVSANTLNGEKVEEQLGKAETVQALNDGEKPTLVPGDFFYFAKVALEKIRLAITFDNNKEAGLLAAYAAERLAEAEELFNAGDEELAVETLKDALDYLTEYEEQAGEELEPVKDNKANPAPVEVQPAEEDKASGQENPAEEEAADEEQDSTEPTEELVRQNIVALKAALEKVQNPKAKAALQKNIDKTYAKIAGKLGQTDEESEETTVPAEEKTPVTEPVVAAEGAATEEVYAAEDDSAAVVPAAPIKQQAKEVGKQEKQEVKEVRKQEKQETKEVRKQMDQKEAIEVKKEQKQEVKEVKQQEKQNAKEAHKESKPESKQSQNDNGKSSQQGKNGKNASDKQ